MKQEDSIDIEQLNRGGKQTVATLNMALDTAPKSEVLERFYELLEDMDGAPTGATIKDKIGVWKPEDYEDEVEPGILIEMWLDTVGELDAVRAIKSMLEQEFDQECICLKLKDVYMEH